MDKIFLTWEDFEALAQHLAEKLNGNRYDVILLVTRAGLFPCSYLCERLGLRNIVSTSVVFYVDTGETLTEPKFLNFPSEEALHDQRVLLVDEVWESGKTITAVRQRVIETGGQPEIAVLHYKPTLSQVDETPDYWAAEADCWIVYPWDPDREKLLAEETV